MKLWIARDWDSDISVYYEKPSSVGSDVSGEAVGLGLGMGVGLVATIMSGILFLIGRMDILSSALLALICYLFTYIISQAIYFVN